MLMLSSITIALSMLVIVWAATDYQILSPRVTNWGDWVAIWSKCSPGEFVIGFQLKTEPIQNDGDDTALNGVELLCARVGSNRYKQIRSLEGQWGSWGRSFYCPNGSVARGFQLRSEAGQGKGDDTGANNLRLLCNSPARDVIEGDGTSWGSWSESQTCPNGQAVTGFRTQVETHQGDGDDTSLNNIDMICNDLPPCSRGGQACDGWRECCSEVCDRGACRSPTNSIVSY